MNKLKTLTLALGVLASAVVFESSAFAQSPTRGTLSVAVNGNAASTIIGVSSATGFGAGTTAMVVGKEYMLVVSISGTSITVNRGRLSTVIEPHFAGEVFWVGSTGSGAGSPFVVTERAGACTSTGVDPVILPGTGKIQTCTGGRWATMSVSAPMQIVRPRTACASTACTALITDDIIGVTVLSAATTISIMPATGVPMGKGFLVINETATAATQISITPTSTNINGTTSFTFTGAYNFVTCVSNATAWFCE